MKKYISRTKAWFVISSAMIIYGLLASIYETTYMRIIWFTGSQFLLLCYGLGVFDK